MNRPVRMLTRRRIGLAAVSAVLLRFLPASAAARESTPVGVWRTFDEYTGRERGVVRIWEQHGVLYGRVEHTTDPAEGKRICDKCQDDRKDRPILGLNIIRGLRRDGDRWDGGEILDPNSGRTYGCSMWVKDGGEKLVVRGFYGVSLLGHSQVWVREE